MGYYRYTVVAVSVVDDAKHAVWMRKVGTDPNDPKVRIVNEEAERVFRARVTRPGDMMGGTRWSIVTTYKDKETGKLEQAYGKPTGYSV